MHDISTPFPPPPPLLKTGARRLSRVLLHKFDAPSSWRPLTPPRSGSIGVGVSGGIRGSVSDATEGRRFSDSSISAAAAAAATTRLVTRAVGRPGSVNPRGVSKGPMVP